MSPSIPSGSLQEASRPPAELKCGREDFKPVGPFRPERMPLSCAQERLWFLCQMKGVSETHHISFGRRLKGNLDRPALRRALDRIVARHEVLRTTFAVVEGEPVQRIQPVEQARFELREEDLRERGETSEELARRIEEEAERAFDLTKGPLIRGQLLQVAEDEHVLLITMHHIVSDGWSMGVLLNELSTLYGAYRAGRGRPAAGVGNAICRLCGVAAAVDGRRGAAGSRQSTGKGAGGGAGAAGVAGGPCAAGAAGLWRRVGRGGAGRELIDRAERVEPAAWSDVVHDAAGGMGGVAGAVVGAGGGGDRDAGGQPGKGGDREADRVFREHAGVRVDVSGAQRVGELLEQVKRQALAAQQHQDIPFEQVVELVQPVAESGA